jgi:hypothetical protein
VMKVVMMGRLTKQAGAGLQRTLDGAGLQVMGGGMAQAACLGAVQA